MSAFREVHVWDNDRVHFTVKAVNDETVLCTEMYSELWCKKWISSWSVYYVYIHMYINVC